MRYEVEVEAERRPTVTLEFDQDTQPTRDEILEKLDELAEDLEMEGYLAEFIVTEGGAWTTTIKEFADDPAS